MPTTRRKKSTKESEPAATWVAIDALTPWADNPRKNDGRPVEAVADSIKRFGFAAPIIARKEDGMVIAGHTRLKAAIKLGLDRVPVRYLDLDPADSRLLALADNKVGELAEWDDEALARIVADIDGAELVIAGFDEDDLSLLIESMRQPGDEDWAGAFDGLPDEDRAPFRQMTFTVHDDQHQEIERALKVAKGLGPFDSENENGNGNALARLAEAFLTGNG